MEKGVIVEVCYGPRCSDYGGKALLAELKEQGIDAQPMHCQSLCPHAPLARIDGRYIHHATLEEVVEMVAESAVRLANSQV